MFLPFAAACRLWEAKLISVRNPLRPQMWPARLTICSSTELENVFLPQKTEFGRRSRWTQIFWIVFNFSRTMSNFVSHCVTQLKLYTSDKLSSTIFCCLWVRHRLDLTKSPRFPIYTGIQTFADPVPPKTKQFQLILTENQPVLSYTDPVPSSTTFNSSSR